MPTAPKAFPLARTRPDDGPLLVPCLMIRHGKVAVPGEEGPVVARGPAGAPLEILDAVDRLSPTYSRLYVVDLDAVEEGRPQLDYLQEIARDTDIWLDAGVRTADEAIDALITGASRAVISSSLVRTPRMLARAWKLSQELVFEVEVRNGTVDAAASEWRDLPPAEVAAAARTLGIPDIILAYREGPIDWELVRRVGHDGPTWVGGSFEPSQLPELTRSAAAGGIFHPPSEALSPAEASSPSTPLHDGPPGPRDDET